MKMEMYQTPKSEIVELKLKANLLVGSSGSEEGDGNMDGPSF